MDEQAVFERDSVMWDLGTPLAGVKLGFATRAVPPAEMAGLVPLSRAPRIGDLVLAEVLSVGKNKTLEVHAGVSMYLFPGDLIVGAFGNRYATDQFEGYVPEWPVKECDLLSVGGVCGEIVSKHAAMGAPTRLRVRGLVSDREGRPINQRAFGLPALDGGVSNSEVILVIGSSMNSGKTTTVGTLARALNRAGYSVAAAKVTGTAAGKDGRFIESCGARPVIDFTSAGYPSTYMLGREELLNVYHALLAHLHASAPDYIILEVADGIFQRETRMLLESGAVRDSVDHVFFAACDSLSAESGARLVRDYDLPLRATAGAITQSLLATREAEEATSLPCLSTERIMDGTLMEILDAGRALESSERNCAYISGPIGRSV
jgi:hypothetical protein